MEGTVVFLVRGGLHDGFGHPHAVILQVAQDEYLCVAGFTPDKPGSKYEEAKKAEHRLGIWGDAFAVEIEHQRHLAGAPAGLELHLCGYVCQTATVLMGRDLNAGRVWGRLSEEATAKIVRGLLSRERQRPYLPRRVVKLLRERWTD